MKKTLLSSVFFFLLTLPALAQLPRPFLISSACPAANNNPSILRRIEPDNSVVSVGTVNLGGSPIIVNGLGADQADPSFAYAMSTVTGSGLAALLPPTFYRINLLNANAVSLGEVTPPPTPTPPPGSPPGSFGVSFAINLAADGAPGSKYYLTGATAIARITAVVPTLIVQVDNTQLYLGEITLPSPVPVWRLVNTSDPATAAVITAFQTAVNNYLAGTGSLPEGGFQDIIYLPASGRIVSYLGVERRFLNVSNITTSPIAVTTTPPTLLPAAVQGKQVGSMFLDGGGNLYAQVSDNGVAYRIDPTTGSYLGASLNLGVGCTRGDAATAPPIIVLPVTLASFTATAEASRVRLAWRTATEARTARFVVERSADGRTWHDVVGVEATNHPEGDRYATIDNRPDPSIHHYRLRTEDVDGSRAYSDVRLVSFDGKPTVLEPYPNPAGSRVTVALNGLLAGDVVLLNSLGQQVRHALLENGRVEFDVADLPAGIYHVVTTLADNQRMVRRLVIAHQASQ